MKVYINGEYIKDIEGDIKVELKSENNQFSGTVHFSHTMFVHGDVLGNAHAGMSLDCKNVGKDADAGMSISCEDIAGNASAGMDVKCNSIGGNAKAGMSLKCSCNKK